MFSSSKYESDISRSVDILEIKRFDERINTFWNNVKCQYSFIVERNRNYLDWRYCDIRGGDYSIRAVEENGSILGYSILRTKEEKNSESNDSIGYIIDLIVLPDRLNLVKTLVDDAIQYFDESSVNLIQVFVIQNHPLQDIFREVGFLNSRIEINVFYKILNKKIEFNKPDSPNRGHIQYGDTDWI
jgi:hypothetical protein